VCLGCVFVPRAARRHCPDTHCICTASRQLFTQLYALPGHAVDSTRSHMPAWHAWWCFASAGNLFNFCDGAVECFELAGCVHVLAEMSGLPPPTTKPSPPSHHRRNISFFVGVLMWFTWHQPGTGGARVLCKVHCACVAKVAACHYFLAMECGYIVPELAIAGTCAVRA
jgi:hypothetical protein